MFISDDCSESFYCTQGAPEAPHGGGCHLTCNNETERVHLDYSTNTWECVSREPDFLCPGRFQVDCVDEINVDCHCDHEFWMRPDCQMAFLCTKKRTPTGQNIGRTIWCFEGEVLHVDLVTMEYSCSKDLASCPGSYHFGCEGGDFDQLSTTTSTTTPPTTTTTTTKPGEDTTTTTISGGDTTTTTTTTTQFSTTTSAGTQPPNTGAADNLISSYITIILNFLFVILILNQGK